MVKFSSGSKSVTAEFKEVEIELATFLMALLNSNC